MTTEAHGVGKHHAGWRPDRLREQRAAHGLTLEAAGERLREVAEQARLQGIPAANPQTLWQHEQGEVYPGPHYRRAYCLLYRATEPDLGFRAALPGEETSTFALTPMEDRVNGSHVLAVERAVHRISSGGEDADHLGLQQRIIDAWKRRHTGGDPHRPVLILVGGYAGSGKTELARFVVQLTGWPLLDKDPLTRPLVERLLVALGGDPNDRHTDLYRENVRPVEYDCLMQSAMANVKCGISTVLSAPFIAEMTDPAWMERLANRAGAMGVDVYPIWVRCDEESMREYITFRSAARDGWKLQRWDEYTATIDLDLRPAVPHLVVDNRLGTAVSLADQARQAMGAMYA
ncbi:AAA family ATPase [Streptomyces sp. NBC_01237]|uniref:AAA family ATPase n=1 Tax=Streptomyces sp. NBC_01237 TaxID=2903790 RepID=UPI002DD8591E|nr:AAA family ATPase [Streptomyces sp. NBC_01237]WRZ76577.1 ATP-binding protein [Streptomyces sp. NBC_01237]